MVLHDLKKKHLKKKLENTKIKTKQKQELLELEREIKEASKLELTSEEQAYKDEKRDKHNERADKLRKGLGSMFNVLGGLANNAVNNLFSEDDDSKSKPKKAKRKKR